MNCRPASGPSRIATATARLSSTTGDKSIRCKYGVKHDNLIPVRLGGGAGLGMNCRNGSLERVRTKPSRPKGLLHQCRALGNHLIVPTGAVLLFKQNDFTVFGNTCFPARSCSSIKRQIKILQQSDE